MRLAFLAAFSLAACTAEMVPKPAPSEGMIDAHRHALDRGMRGPTASETVATMDALGIDRSVAHFATRSLYEEWPSGHEARFLKGVSFPCWRGNDGDWFACNWDDNAHPDMAWLRQEVDAGRLTHFGEMGFVYAGVSPTDPAMMPYWNFAAENDLPVLVHSNRGPPPNGGMRALGCCPDFDPDMGNPSLLRPILERHPDLRIVLQHFGFPPLPVFDGIDYIDESIAIMRDYPNVMVDMTTFQSVPFVSAEMHAAMVKRLKNEGMIDRLLYGSDGWPEAEIIARYEAMDFLTDADRRAIFRGNAERLFGL